MCISEFLDLIGQNKNIYINRQCLKVMANSPQVCGVQYICVKLKEPAMNHVKCDLRIVFYAACLGKQDILLALVCLAIF